MILKYNGRFLSSFKCGRLIKVTETYHAHEAQQIARYGAVHAVLSVPTVREINAYILIRACNETELRTNLSDLHEWLFDVPSSKLFLDKSLVQYYKARCVNLSEPEYKGLSCTVIATFICEDFRAYRTYDDSPIGDAFLRLQNFRFAGKHCLNDLGCMFILDGFDAIPKPRLHKYEITGNNGTIRYDDGLPLLEEKTLDGTLYFVNSALEPDRTMTDNEISNRMHSIASFLLMAKRGELILDRDITRAYEAEIEAAAAFDDEKWANGTIKVKFTVQPVLHDVSVSTITKTISVNGSDPSVIELSDLLPDGTGWETPINISIKNASAQTISDITISYKGVDNASKNCRISGGGFSLAPNGVLSVSHETYSVKVNGTSMMSALYSGTFPVLYPSNFIPHKLWIKANVQATLEVTVSAKGRWV